MTPVNGPNSLAQMRRLDTGQLEIFLRKLCCFLGFDRNIMVRQRMVYAYFSLCGFFSAEAFFYAIFLALFFLSGKSFLPMISEPSLAIAVALFISIFGFKLFKFLRIGGSIREWWNNQRMLLFQCLSPLLLAMFGILMKLLRVSEIVFVVTPKRIGDEDDAFKYHTFRDMPFFRVLLQCMGGDKSVAIWQRILVRKKGNIVDEGCSENVTCSSTAVSSPSMGKPTDEAEVLF